MRLFKLAVLGIVISGCNDATVTNNAAVLDSGGDGSGLYNSRLGKQVYGYAQLTFSQTAAIDDQDSVGIIARGTSKQNLYTCNLFNNSGSNGLVITRTKDGGSADIIASAGLNTDTLIGTHYLGCEIVKDGALDRINLYYDADGPGPQPLLPLVTVTLGENGNDTDPIATGYWGFDGLDGGTTVGDRKVSNWTFSATKPTPTFYFEATQKGANGLEAYDAGGFPFRAVGNANVSIARFAYADGVAPTCTASNFVVHSFAGDGNGACAGTNTPTLDACTCAFDSGSTVNGSCHLAFNSICASDQANVGTDIGDRVSFNMVLTAPANASATANTPNSYDWYAQNSD